MEPQHYSTKQPDALPQPQTPKVIENDLGGFVALERPTDPMLDSGMFENQRTADRAAGPEGESGRHSSPRDHEASKRFTQRSRVSRALSLVDGALVGFVVPNMIHSFAEGHYSAGVFGAAVCAALLLLSYVNWRKADFLSEQAARLRGE